MHGAVPDWETGLKLSRVRRAALLTIAKELEQEKTARLVEAIRKGVGI